MAHAVFILLLIAIALPTKLLSPALALFLGTAFGLLFKHPFPDRSRKVAKYLLQASVVGLGFGMDLVRVLHAGAAGFIYTAIGIVFALLIGTILGKVFAVQSRASFLISVGTAICGGSAIAAVAPVVDASDEEISVSIGTVFLLNALGLVLFPVLGHRLGLSEADFGLWSALAIHDTSSVVGAAAQYGTTALAIATTVKLARALWIIPVTLGAATLWRRRNERGERKKQLDIPWFVLLFLLAAMVNTYFHAGSLVYSSLVAAAKTGLCITLFLIGTGITIDNLKRVGFRPLAQGIVLWIVVALFSLALIARGWASV